MTQLRTAAFALFFALVGASIVALVDHPSVLVPGGADAQSVPGVRSFSLDIVPKDIELGGGAVWHAWTFNGSVPGPTLTVTVGDVLRVTVHNSMNSTHSFHTHLSPYSLANDGSQLNTITGIGGMAMIPPNGSYTYEFLANVPGLFYYHDHSADGGHTIHEHIAQGLYGAILVKAINEAPVDDQVLFMSERGFDVSTPTAPFYIMNGHGLPGGEHALEQIFAKYGVPGVVAQVGTTLPALSGRVGVPTRVDVVNIGDMVHTFHMHGMTAYLDDGKPLTAQVLALDPGEAGRVTITPTEAGLWLFHCHVVSHADAGMIGVFVVQPREGALQLPAPDARALAFTPSDDDAASGMGDMTGGVSSTLTITSSVGEGGELSFSPTMAHAAAGHVTVTFHNGGRATHALSFPELGADTGPVAPGADAKLEIDVKDGRSYAYVCSVPGHADAGMKGTLMVP